MRPLLSYPRADPPRANTVRGTKVRVDSPAGAFAAVEWAHEYREILDASIDHFIRARNDEASEAVLLRLFVLIAQISQLAGASLRVAGELYQRHGLNIQDLPASVRGNGFRYAVTLTDGGVRRVQRLFVSPGDWIRAGRELQSQAARFLERVTPADRIERVDLSAASSMKAIPAAALLVVVALSTTGLVIAAVLAVDNATGWFGVFDSNRRAFRESLVMIEQTLAADLATCDRDGLTVEQRQRCIDDAYARAVERTAEAQERYGTTGSTMGRLLVGSAAAAAALYFATR